MHDIVNLEAQGIPGLFVATEVFEDGASEQAKALGAAPASVYIPHPIQDRTADEVSDLADSAFDQIVSRLIAS